MHYQLEDYLKKSLLYKYQPGFIAGFSTDSCLAHLTDFVISGMDKGMHTAMIFIDLKKALDTLDFKILLKKMTCLGFITAVIKWFESYVSSRKFCVSVDDIFSKVGTLNCGVPQGFILGPLLFLLYINNFPQSLSVFYQEKEKKLQKIEDVLTKEFSTLCEWLVDNNMSIRFGENETKCILFSKTNCSSKINVTTKIITLNSTIL